MTAKLFVIPQATVPDSTKEDMLALIDTIRAEVESGTTSGVIIITGSLDDRWNNVWAGDFRYADAVFHLGVTQQSMIYEYIKREGSSG